MLSTLLLPPLLAAGYSTSALQPVGHSVATLSSMSSMDDNEVNCASEHHPHPFNFSSNCPPGSSSCWPALYLLGVQKAGTTSVTSGLMKCGAVAFGMAHGEIPYCEKGVGCKETLHPPANIMTDAGITVFTKLHDTTRCHELNKDWKVVTEACRAGRFLEATPLGVGDTPNVGTLLQAIPPQYSSTARYAIIFREPVARMLSWFNHLVAIPEMSAAASERRLLNSFDAWYKYTLKWTREGMLDAFQNGKYIEWIKQYQDNPHVQRSQLLVLQFEALVKEPATAMKLLTTHYGLPQVLTGMHKLPEENTFDSPQKVISIICSTREEAAAAYEKDNQALYVQLASDRAHGRAPSLEPAFPAFDIHKSVPCGQAQLTKGGGLRSE